MSDQSTNTFDRHALLYTQASQLNEDECYDEAVAMCNQVLSEPRLSGHHRMLVCICLVDSTGDWDVGEIYRKQAEQVYALCRLLFPTGSLDAQHEAAMSHIRELLDRLDVSQRDQAPSEANPYEIEAATQYAEDTIEEMAKGGAKSETEGEEEAAAYAIFEKLADANPGASFRELFEQSRLAAATGAATGETERASGGDFDSLASTDVAKTGEEAERD